MSLIAVSDLHLAPGETELQSCFVRFLEFIKPEAESVIINGDLFNFWFGYRDVVPYCYVPTLSKLLDLADSGVTFKYLHGNHDFNLGPFFERVLPAMVFTHSLQMDYLGTKVHVEHGDLLDPEDIGYRFLRKVVRSRPIAWLFHALPPHIGLHVANGSAHISRNYVISKKSNFYYHCFEAAYKTMKSGADLVVYGHGHRTIFSEMLVDNRQKLLVMLPGFRHKQLYFLRLAPDRSGLFMFDMSSGKERPLHLFDIATLGKELEA